MLPLSSSKRVCRANSIEIVFSAWRLVDEFRARRMVVDELTEQVAALEKERRLLWDMNIESTNRWISQVRSAEVGCCGI